jgi:hypothetical protein
MIVCAATITTRPIAAYKIVFLAVLTFCGSPPEVIYMKPPRMIMMTATDPVTKAIMSVALWIRPFVPVSGLLVLLLPAQSVEDAADPLQLTPLNGSLARAGAAIPTIRLALTSKEARIS